MRRDLTNLCSKKEQGRRDDLWSLLYLLIELATGGLPWGHLRGIENMVINLICFPLTLHRRKYEKSKFNTTTRNL